VKADGDAHPSSLCSFVSTLIWQDDKASSARPAVGAVHDFLRRQVPALLRPAARAHRRRLPGGGFNYKLISHEFYFGRAGLYGWIGSVDAAHVNFIDTGAAPDFGIQPPKGTNPFKIADGANTANTNKWPGAVTFHEQRRVFARSDARPDFFDGSAGDISRFDVNDPAQDADSYELAALLAAARGDPQPEVVRPPVPVHRPGRVQRAGQGRRRDHAEQRRGAPPQRARLELPGPDRGRARAALQHGEGQLRPRLLLRLRSNAYVGSDSPSSPGTCSAATRSSPGRTSACRITSSGSSRSDGTLLSLTYDRATQTVAWAQHETDGEVQAVACIPDGTEDALFLCVLRNGSPRMEKMASRDYIPDVRLACFLDAALLRRPQHRRHTMKVTGASYDAEDLVTIEASVASFAATDVGDQIVIDPDGDADAHHRHRVHRRDARDRAPRAPLPRRSRTSRRRAGAGRATRSAASGTSRARASPSSPTASCRARSPSPAAASGRSRRRR
jgi:hypothetical protein